MKFLALIFGVIPSLLIASTVPIDREVVQVKECGMEQRDSYEQLLPIAISEPVNLKCNNCNIEFTFNVPQDGGNPTNVDFRYSGMSQESAKEYKSVFVRGWAFPGCKEDGKAKGFTEERRAFNA